MDIRLYTLPKMLKNTLVVFLLTLAFGYLSGVDLLKHTTDFKSKGLEKNVLGNEMDEYADELHFKMSERELHGIIHSHVITLGVLFVMLSLMLYFTSYSQGLKSFLMIEPLVSLIATFGGLWLLWAGVVWMKYIIMVSGTLMHLSFVLIVLLLLRELMFKKK